jgi:S1-C subfamily serine protease
MRDEFGSGNDLINAVRAKSPGDTLTLTIYRDGRRMDVEVKCFESGSSD